MKIEAKIGISPNFLKIYHKILFENIYLYISYTINDSFLYWGVFRLIFWKNNTFFFIKFGIINMYLLIVADFFFKKRRGNSGRFFRI